MSVTLSEPDAPPERDPEADAGRPLADASQLIDRMPAWSRTPRAFALHVVVLALAFVYFSFQPLWHSDLWGHLAYGRFISENGGLPATEPFMPLAEGVPVVDSAWLSQVVGFTVHDRFGLAGLQFLCAAGITLCLSLLAWRSYERTGNFVAGFAALVAFLWLQSHAFVVIRPQLAGLCCFVIPAGPDDVARAASK